MKRSKSQYAFQVFDIVFMVLIMATIIVPILNILSLSVSSADAIRSGSVTFYPKGFSLDAYKDIIGNRLFASSVYNTVFTTVVGTVLAVTVTLLVAYALTKDFVGKKFITYYFVLTMYFGGGLIPTYLVVSNLLHMRNTYSVLIFPSLVSMFYIIVMRSQIEAMPKTVFEAAHIDGANEFQTVFRVVLPMIMPTIAAISMFFALNFWNSWFNVMVYTNKDEYWTLQYFLRAVVLERMISQYSTKMMVGMREVEIPEENFRMAAIVLTAGPILATVAGGSIVNLTMSMVEDARTYSGTVSGVIRDQKGAAVAGCFVGLYQVTGTGAAAVERLVSVTKTNEEGKYLFGGVAGGQYLVKAKMSR